MAEPAVTVNVQGLRDLRRDLKAIEATLPRELTKAQKEAAEIVAARARQLAPHRTGRLAGSVKPFAAGTKAGVRSNVPYANPVHWGWPRRGIAANPFIWDAWGEKRDDFVEALGDAIEGLARRHGFHR